MPNTSCNSQAGELQAASDTAVLHWRETEGKQACWERICCDADAVCFPQQLVPPLTYAGLVQQIVGVYQHLEPNINMSFSIFATLLARTCMLADASPLTLLCDRICRITRRAALYKLLAAKLYGASHYSITLHPAMSDALALAALQGHQASSRLSVLTISRPR